MIGSETEVGGDRDSTAQATFRATVRALDDAARSLDTLSAKHAEVALFRCCGSFEWVERMLAARPFGSGARLLEQADRAFAALENEDWLQAFEAHPRIGERGLHERWARGEQASMAAASDETIAAISAGNRSYEARFGHVFLICATGLEPDDMLGALERRLEASPEDELEEAAREQAKITRLRLVKLGRELVSLDPDPEEG